MSGTNYYPPYHPHRATIFNHYPKIYIAPKPGEELVDPRKRLEPGCMQKCKFWSHEYMACVQRFKANPTRSGDCEPQYGGYCRCIDRCIAVDLFKFLK